jgi:hypothetical protein
MAYAAEVDCMRFPVDCALRSLREDRAPSLLLLRGWPSPSLSSLLDIPPVPADIR